MPRRRYARALQEETGQPTVAPQQAKPAQAQTDANPMIALQRMVGNAAIQRVLTGNEPTTMAPTNTPSVTDTATNSPTNSNTTATPNQTTNTPASAVPAAPGLLSADGVVRAMSYYNIRAADYPPHIISQIQGALGVAETGRATPEMVQAVADFQSQNGLAVDGMAGPRTLPAIFEQGLDTEQTEEVFADEALDALSQWDSKSPEERAQALIDAANAGLAEHKISECTSTIVDLNVLAQFDFTTWNIELGKGVFEAATISNADYADAANTVYHESRHAEQWFSMARLLAGQGKTAQEIATQMGIPLNIANEAAALPYKPGSMEALVANGWYESVYGVDADYRNKTLTDLEKASTDLEAAEADLAANDTPANRAKVATLRRKHQTLYDEYHNLPEETDAHRVGDAIEARILLKAELPDEG